MTEHRARKPIYKWVSFWLVLLLVLYTIIGFLVLPLIAEKQLPKQLEKHLGWQGNVENVDFNPYLMTLEVTGFEANDSESRPVLNFQRLFTDLGFLQLFTGTIRLDDITLEQPFVRVDLLPDYGVNMARDWARHHDSEPEPESTEESGSPPSLFFNSVNLKGGEIQFRDLSQETEQVFDIKPLSITLKDLAIFSEIDKASDYELNAAIGEQQIQWQGTLNIVPFQSEGSIKLDKINYSTIWHFANAYAPYVLTDGELSLNTDYRIETGDELVLQTSSGQLSIANLRGRLTSGEEPFLTLAKLEGSDIEFDLQAQQFSMASVSGDQLDARLQRDAEGNLNVAKPFQSADSGGSGQDGNSQNSDGTQGEADGADADSGQQSNGDGFKWAVEQVTLSNSHINWQDATTENPVSLDLNAINLELGTLSQALDKPVSYKLEMNTGEQGAIAVNGQTTFQPFTLQSALNLDQVGLTPFEPYVGQNINLALRKGLLSVNGDLDLDALDPVLTGTFSGQGQIDDLSITRPENEDALLAWQSVTVKPIALNFDPMRLEIGAIDLQSPRSRFVRMADGTTNFSNLTGTDDASEEDSGAQEEQAQTADSEQAASAGEEDQSDFVFRIDSISLADGEVNLTDRSVDPAFDNRLHALNGSVKGLTNVPPQQATIDLEGKVGEFGDLVFNGSLATVGGEEDKTTLEITTSNVALPEISPYFANYLGYKIDNGKLKLDLNYTINGTKISADNQVIMDQLELGEKVQSKQSVSVPVKLALTLLKNSDGVIDLTLPIDGDLNDPSFRVTPVIMNTLLNVLGKAATSPFSVLGSVVDLAGFSADELGEVAFVPGKTELAKGEDDKLKVLAEALSERKGVALKFRGSVAPDVDRVALRSEQLFEELGVSASDPVDEIISALESALVEREGEERLNSLQAQAGMEGESRLQNTQWLQQLSDTLVQGQTVSDQALSELANKRGSMLQQRLVEDFDIPSEQLFPLAPSTDGEIGMKNGTARVIVPFTLDSK